MKTYSSKKQIPPKVEGLEEIITYYLLSLLTLMPILPHSIH